MPLKKYQQMRRFDQTAEPKGKVKRGKSSKLEFVVQKHDASRLHYDFRLEMGGVLKSWAVPKGPSLKPSDKHLAMMTEDHPYDYRKFEGKIPEGNYGAGDVIVWDKGTYEPLESTDDPEAELLRGLKKGHLAFKLHGQKLNGGYDLVRTRGMEDNAWLLIKKDDEFAENNDVTQQLESVLSGQLLPRDNLNNPTLEDAPKTNMPVKVKPMLATLVQEPFDSPDWLFEIKWDGYRAIGGWDGKKAELYSRNQNDFSAKYPAIYEALHNLKKPALLDGEIVSVDTDGKSHFEWLQNYQSDPEGQLLYYVFDLLWLDGYDLQDWPLTARKDLLQELIKNQTVIRYSDHVRSNGKKFFNMAKERQLEGMVAKKCDGSYHQGLRSKEWLKIKTHKRQEVVIGGFTEPRGSRKHLGALLVGVYKGNDFTYVGHVGGGIPPKQMADLRNTLEKLERQKSPFKEPVKPNAPVHWVRPEIVCEVSFAEWTSENIMRQPIFMGLRSDKPAKSVKKEELMSNKPNGSQPSQANNTAVNFTNSDKIFWPEAGYTKGDLWKYYDSVHDLILPYLKDRPESMLRMPNGYKGKSFFQKDAAGTVPNWAKTIKIYSESNKKNIEYFICNNTQDLQLMVQLGCIEINPWSSRTKSLHKPDWLVLDLDPEGSITYNQVVQVALEAKKVCDELNIPAYPKTSGKTGLHIFIPCEAKYTYDQLKSFGEILANLVHERISDITSVERMPAKRPNKIYIDFLQNREGQTLAAPYSVRPTKAASVSTPLHWDEVKRGLDPYKFTIKTAPKRFNRVGDLWQPVLGKGIDLKKILADMS